MPAKGCRNSIYGYVLFNRWLLESKQSDTKLTFVPVKIKRQHIEEEPVSKIDTELKGIDTDLLWFLLS